MVQLQKEFCGLVGPGFAEPTPPKATRPGAASRRQTDFFGPPVLVVLSGAGRGHGHELFNKPTL